MDTSNDLFVQINFGCYPDPGPYLDLQLYHQRTVGRHVKEWILWMVFWVEINQKEFGSSRTNFLCDDSFRRGRISGLPDI